MIAETASLFSIEHNGPFVDGQISVVVPTYNCEKELLARCLTSIRAQHGVNLELIVVDDGSKPQYNVQDVAAESADLVIPLKENKGACHARNTGWLASAGEFVLFFDSDNYMHAGMLVTLHSILLVYPEADMVYSNFKRDGSEFSAGPFTLDQLLVQNRIDTPALIRSNRFVGFDPRVPRGQDWDAWLRMIKMGRSAVKVNYPLFTLTTERSGRITNSVKMATYLNTMKRLHPDLQLHKRGKQAEDKNTVGEQRRVISRRSRYGAKKGKRRRSLVAKRNQHANGNSYMRIPQ